MNASLTPEEILRWHIAAGADEAIGETAIDRYAAPPKQPVVFREDRPSLPIIPAPPALDGAHPALACRTLAELKDALFAYEGCALKKTCRQTVFADGTPGSGVMLVGEAPGADEDRIGLPFVGASGRLLDRMLASIGLDRNSCYITNLVPWRPPGNRKPEQTEIELCLPFLIRHIELVAPRFLLLLGGAPTSALLGRHDAISRLRGRWHDCVLPPEGKIVPALPTFHPAYLLRTPAHKRLVWADFLALRKRLDEAA